MCLSNGTTGYSNIQLININGSIYDRVFYKYTHCHNSSIMETLLCPKSRLIACVCLSEKTAFLFEAFVCNVTKIKLMRYAHFAVALVGMFLNLIVLGVYIRRKNIQNKIGNILLLSQAVFHIFNTLLYAIPTSILYFSVQPIYHRMSKSDEMIFYLVIHSLFFFSYYCSMFGFTLIAVERCLALSRPFWHRGNVTRQWILKGIAIVCISASLLTLFNVYVDSGNVTPTIIWIKNTIGLIWLAAVSALFLVPFLKAYVSLKRLGLNRSNRAKERKSAEHVKTRTDDVTILTDSKVFRLTTIFLITYLVFLLALIPGFVATALWFISGRKTTIGSVLYGLSFTATSIVNPVLTMTLRYDFKLTCAESTKMRSKNTKYFQHGAKDSIFEGHLETYPKTN